MSPQIRPQGLEIESTDPYAKALPQRKALGDLMKKLVGSQGAFVLALDGKWGSGKTTFLEMWTADLKREKFPVIQFNAWASDFTNDPLAAMLGEVGYLLQDRLGNTTTAFEATKRWGAKILALGGPPLVKAMTANLVDIESFKDAFSEIAENSAEKLIEEFSKSKDTIDCFKKSLEAAVAAIPTEEGSPRKPLVFIIDELDRCRPSFAVELLERAKHLFNVPGIVFVLALDRQQLAISLQTIYGAEFDSAGYLHRFIDLDLRLPASSNSPFIASLLERLNAEKVFTAYYRQYRHNGLALTSGFLHAAGASIRAQEQIIHRMAIAYSMKDMIGPPVQLSPIFVVPLLTLSALKPDVYRSLVEGYAESHVKLRAWASSTSGIDEFFTVSEAGRRAGIFLLYIGELARGRIFKEIEISQVRWGSVEDGTIAEDEWWLEYLQGQFREMSFVKGLIAHVEFVERFAPPITDLVDRSFSYRPMN